MKITSIERFVLETIENDAKSFNDILSESGLQENICFNTLQALVIKNIISTNGIHYSINKNLPRETVEKINSSRSRKEESAELIENFLNTNSDDFILSKVALTEKDHKILRAMLKNLDSFIKDCHAKTKKEVVYKNRTLVFWGMTKTENIIKEMVG